MGGTFDPIHHGHLVAGSEVQARFGLDEVVFVPTGSPWQKADRIVSPAEDRYLMTVDTLRDLQAQRGPNTELYFITGADALASILTWHGGEALFSLAHFVGCSRPGVPLDAHDISHLPSDRVTLLEIPALAISSTAVRERVAVGLPIWYLVPDGIVQHINKRGLYRGLALAAPRTQPQPAASQ
jgi:nicotinate-nucleotide adenylyltransferase